MLAVEAGMPEHLALKSLTAQEGRVLKAKVHDLSLSARIHQRYRIVGAQNEAQR